MYLIKASPAQVVLAGAGSCSMLATYLSPAPTIRSLKWILWVILRHSSRTGIWLKSWQSDVFSKICLTQVGRREIFYLWLAKQKNGVSLSSVQSPSCVRLFVWLFATPWIAACQASLSITNSRSLLKLMSIELVMPFSHFILCCPLLLLPSIFPSIRVFSNESMLRMRWPKYWSFSFSISPSNEHPGLFSFRMVWLDILAVHGTLKSLLQQQS